MNRCCLIACVIFAGVEVSTQRMMMCQKTSSGWRREGLGLRDQAAAKLQHEKKESMRSGYDMREWLHGSGVVLKNTASSQQLLSTDESVRNASLQQVASRRRLREEGDPQAFLRRNSKQKRASRSPLISHIFDHEMLLYSRH